MNIVGIVPFLFFVTGFILFAGNVGGCLTTFPLAGFMFMTAGGLMGKAAGE